MRGGSHSNGLTARQAEILLFVANYTAEAGYPPTMQDICDHLGIVSTNAVHGHLVAIARKGFLRRTPGASRGLKVLKLPGEP